MRKVVAIACCAALVVVAASAFAAKPRIPSTVSLHTEEKGSDFIFRGRVKSEKHACEANRRVRITAGHPFKQPPHEEGTVKTDATGRYELRVKAATNTLGGYKATALRKTRPNFICKVARSEVVGP